MIKTQVIEKTQAPQAPESPVEPATPTDLMRVLHVEDNPADAMLMQEYLRGVLPSVVFDTAVRLAELTPDRAATADCALLDLSLPDASGLDAVIALRGMSENLPIIVLTGFDNLELGLAAVRGGADDYLVKSHVDGYSLERAVQYSVERRRLMLEIASSTFTAASATATAKAAVAATEIAEATTAADAIEHASQLAAAGTADEDTNRGRAAEGTHEVSVRIDAETGDYALRCACCDWEADRGTDVLHSWSDRSLDVVLLHHLDYSRLGQVAAAAKTETSPVPRRRVLRPRTWLPAGSKTGPAEATDHPPAA